MPRPVYTVNIMCTLSTHLAGTCRWKEAAVPPLLEAPGESGIFKLKTCFYKNMVYIHPLNQLTDHIDY